MILQALAEHYETLVAQGKLPKDVGWSISGISYALDIGADGRLQQVLSVQTEQQRGKKTVLAPQQMVLPAPVERTAGIKPNYTWDNSAYLLGVSAKVPKNGPDRIIKCFEAFRNFHHKLLDGVESPAAKALLAFCDSWDPATAAQHPALQDYWEAITTTGNIVFRYDGHYIHEDPEIQQAWQKHYDTDVGQSEMICLISGRKGPVESTHPSIKGVRGAQASGAAMVSFNADALCSYGHDQSLNAPVCKPAAFAYTAALNYLLQDRDHVQDIGNGDTTVVCWSKDGSSMYQDLLLADLFGNTPSTYTAGELEQILDRLLQGERVQYNESMLDPNMDFFILGLSPNAARLSVRFFWHNSFGQLLRNVHAHHERLQIEGAPNNIPLWRLLGATVNQKAKNPVPSPILSGAMLNAILTDTRYPATLLNGITMRIRAETQAPAKKGGRVKRESTAPVTSVRAAAIKAYYTKNIHPDIPKEVLTVSLNPNCDTPAYVLGRMFSVYEDIQMQANPGINATIKDKYFTSAAATPATIFPILGSLAQKHLKKLRGSNLGFAINLDKQLTEIASLLGPGYPAHMSLPEQGAFQLGYYHQTKARYTKKEETTNA